MKKILSTLILILFIFSCKDKIIPPPTADFTFTVAKGEVTFTNKSTNADTYKWSFGDGQGESTEKNPKYIYKYPNDRYFVTLKAIGTGGETQIQKEIEVKAVKPIVAFTFTYLDNGDVQFTNETKDADSYEWEIQGQTKLTIANPKVSFIYNGEYKVKLRAIGFGEFSETEQIIKITNGKEPLPKVAFTFQDFGGGKYRFTNKSQNASSYSWDFGDNGKSNIENPEYLYDENGTYKVTLTATGKGGVSSKDSLIKVTSSPIKYSHIVENKSIFTITLYNNDLTKPYNNFSEITIEPNSKATIKTQSILLVPMFKSEDSNLSIEYSISSDKTYILSAYYLYTLDNRTSYTITAYNNDRSKPQQNFSDITILPNSKATIKSTTKGGITPMLKSSDPNLNLEYSTTDNKTYIFNAYYYFYEVRFTGDCKAITVITNIKGQKETYNNVSLPSSYNTKATNIETLEVQAFKNNVVGALNVYIYFKNILIRTETITDPFADISIKYNYVKKTFDIKEYSPEEWKCGTYNGNVLFTGPRGGCYYINSNGNKTYVDRAYCNCD